MKKRLDLLFPPEKVREPVIYRMVKEFDVLFNIRRARVDEKMGEMVVELEGPETVLSRAIDWLKSQQIRVEPVTHDAMEG